METALGRVSITCLIIPGSVGSPPSITINYIMAGNRQKKHGGAHKSTSLDKAIVPLTMPDPQRKL
jgi:hypothetical protein